MMKYICDICKKEVSASGYSVCELYYHKREVGTLMICDECFEAYGEDKKW